MRYRSGRHIGDDADDEEPAERAEREDEREEQMRWGGRIVEDDYRDDNCPDPSESDWQHYWCRDEDDNRIYRDR